MDLLPTGVIEALRFNQLGERGAERDSAPPRRRRPGPHPQAPALSLADRENDEPKTEPVTGSSDGFSDGLGGGLSKRLSGGLPSELGDAAYSELKVVPGAEDGSERKRESGSELPQPWFDDLA